MRINRDLSSIRTVKDKTYANLGNSDVLSEIPDKESLVILDVGCGAGDNARCLVEKGHTVDGITLSKREEISAEEWCRTVWRYDLEKGLPFEALSREYDVIICSHVIEHIAYPLKLLEDINAILSDSDHIKRMNSGPGAGGVVVALPNPLFIRNRISWFRGYFEYEDSGLMDYTHLRFYTFFSASRLFEENGFYVVRHYGSGYFPLGLFRRYFPYLASKLDAWAVRVFPGVFSTQIIIVGRPCVKREVI